MSLWSYVQANWHMLGTLTLQHAALVVSSVAIATVAGVALGWRPTAPGCRAGWYWRSRGCS